MAGQFANCVSPPIFYFSYNAIPLFVKNCSNSEMNRKSKKMLTKARYLLLDFILHFAIIYMKKFTSNVTSAQGAYNTNILYIT